MGRVRSDRTILGPLTCCAWVLALTWCCCGVLTGHAAGFPAADLPPHPPVQEARGEAPQVAIDFRGGRLSIGAHEVPWTVVLPALERQTGIQIQVKGPLAGALTQDFEALPLEQGLRRLFRQVNVVWFYAKGTEPGQAGERLVRVWVFPREGDTPEARQVRAPPAGPMPDPGGTTAEPNPQADAVPPEGEVAVEEQDPAERLRGLDAFAREGNTEALEQGLLDPDEAVRVRALELLEQGEMEGQ